MKAVGIFYWPQDYVLALPFSVRYSERGLLACISRTVHEADTLLAQTVNRTLC